MVSIMQWRKLFLILAALFILFIQPVWQKPKLNPGIPPGGNFDLTGFKLQLPVGKDGKMEEVLPDALAGTTGFTNSYFYTDKDDGAMTMMVPETGIVSPHSTHCRTELREITPGWLAFGNHVLEVTVSVPQVRDRTTIAQIYQAKSFSKPLCELEYFTDGKIKLMLNQTLEGNKGSWTQVGKVEPGTQFKFLLGLSDRDVLVNINGTNTVLTLPLVFAGQSFYFKVGNYDQTSKAGVPDANPWSVVKFYQISIKHT